MAKKGLGRGLNALLDYGSEPEAEPTPGGVVYMDIRKIEPNRKQPRRYFDDDALAELAESVKSYGIIQPLIVNDCGDYYSIVAGERRFRAARLAQVTELPVLIKNYTEMETLQIALIENIQRQDLTPIEEATCYKRLIEDFFFTQEDIAAKIGKNRNVISNAVRLLDLDERVQDKVSEGKLTASHARALLAVKDREAQCICAERIEQEGLSVRETESLVALQNEVNEADENADAESTETDEQEISSRIDALQQAARAAYRQVEEELQLLLGAKVNIHHGKKKGKIEIEYYSSEELDRLLCLFKGMEIPPGVEAAQSPAK